MKTLGDILFILLILSGFGLLGSSRLGSCIRFSAVQGVVVGLLVMIAGGEGLSLRVAAVGLAVIVLKGVVFPALLSRALRDSDTSREVQPVVGYTPSLLIGALSLGASFRLDEFVRLPGPVASPLVVPVAFWLLIIGLFLLISRRTAVNQVIGFIVLENGVYAFGSAAAARIPLAVELGVLMDVFVAVFVMGIAVYHINREFDHIDSTRLDSLKG